MRKFNALYKDQQKKAQDLNENKIAGALETVYSALLEKYEVSAFKELTPEYQDVFLNELNTYWSDSDGISEKGNKFLQGNSEYLSEHASTIQKKNFFKKKVLPIVEETIRQTNLKYKIYDLINEMYKDLNASQLSDVLTPNVLFSVISESYVKAGEEFLTEIHYELFENANNSEDTNQLYEREFSKEEREKLAKKGYALSDGSFPIVNEQDLKNAIKSYGRGDNPKKEKAHIIKRAKALGKSSILPKKWKVNEVLNEGRTPEQKNTMNFVKGILKQLGIRGVKAKILNGVVNVYDKKLNNLLQIPIKGYISIPDWGDYAPSDFMEKEDEIKTAISSQLN